MMERKRTTSKPSLDQTFSVATATAMVTLLETVPRQRKIPATHLIRSKILSISMTMATNAADFHQWAPEDAAEATWTTTAEVAEVLTLPRSMPMKIDSTRSMRWCVNWRIDMLRTRHLARQICLDVRTCSQQNTPTHSQLWAARRARILLWLKSTTPSYCTQMCQTAIRKTSPSPVQVKAQCLDSSKPTRQSA